MLSQIDRKKIRRRVRYRIRKKIAGTAERPRIAVYRSLKHIYAQAIDDDNGRTLAHASTQGPGAVAETAGRGVEAAKQVGASLADKLKATGVKQVVLDRGGFVYHGRVKALAEALREAGLKF